MAVGSLFDVEIVPGGGGYIGEGGVVAGEVGGVLRGTVQHAVEDSDGLRTGDVAVGRVGGAVAVDPAELIGSVNVAGSPVAVGIREDGARAGVVGAVAAGDHGRDLRTGDGIVRAEVAVSAAVDDAELRHGGHSGVVPGRGRNVLEGIIGGGIRLAGGIRQETIEDRRGLGTGDGVGGLEGAVGIALDVGVVVGAVEHVGNIGLVAGPHGGEVVGAAGLGQIPAVEGVAGTGGVGQRVVAVDVEGLLGREGRAAELRGAAVRVNDHGRAVREVRVLALAVVIVVVVDGVGVIGIILRPACREGDLIYTSIGRFPAVERVSPTLGVRDRVVARQVERLLFRGVAAAILELTAVRVNDDLCVVVELDRFVLRFMIPAVERDDVLSCGVFLPLCSQLHNIAALILALFPADKGLAISLCRTNRGVLRDRQHELARLPIVCCIVCIDIAAAIQVQDNILPISNLEGRCRLIRGLVICDRPQNVMGIHIVSPQRHVAVNRNNDVIGRISLRTIGPVVENHFFGSLPRVRVSNHLVGNPILDVDWYRHRTAFVVPIGDRMLSCRGRIRFPDAIECQIGLKRIEIRVTIKFDDLCAIAVNTGPTLEGISFLCRRRNAIQIRSFCKIALSRSRRIKRAMIFIHICGKMNLHHVILFCFRRQRKRYQADDHDQAQKQGQ